MKYVYVAGSISANNPVTMLNNIRRGIDMGAELLRHGLFKERYFHNGKTNKRILYRVA